jgi:predicted permease
LQDLYFEKGWLLPALFMGVILISTGIGYREGLYIKKGSRGGVCSTAFIVFGNTGFGAFLRRVNLGRGLSFGNCIPQFWRHFTAIHGRNICPHMRGNKILQNALSQAIHRPQIILGLGITLFCKGRRFTRCRRIIILLKRCKPRLKVSRQQLTD